MIASIGDRDLADARAHRNLHLARVLQGELHRQRDVLTATQHEEVVARIQRHESSGLEQQQAVAVFDAERL